MDSRSPEPADFLADTQVSASESPGRYRCQLSDRWNAALLPFGSVVSVVGLRAMAAELDHPTHRLRSATTVFSSAIRAGELEIDVQPIRVGRRMSQLSATVRNGGSSDSGHVTLASFGESREGFEFTGVTMPAVGPPEDYPHPEEPPPDRHRWKASFFDQLELRPVLQDAPWRDDWKGGRAEVIRWVRFRTTPRLDTGELDPLALVALADTMPPAVGQYLGPDPPFFYAPSCDLTVHVLGSTTEEWLLLHVTCARAGRGYATADAHIWSKDGALLANATQLMYLRLGDPESLTI